jgi:hypothetical protein
MWMKPKPNQKREAYTNGNPTPPDSTATPVGLGKIGKALWQDITTNYLFEDAGSLAVLEQACRSLDRAARCAAAIDRDGEMIKLPNGTMRSNPLLRMNVPFGRSGVGY